MPLKTVLQNKDIDLAALLTINNRSNYDKTQLLDLLHTQDDIANISQAQLISVYLQLAPRIGMQNGV